MQKSKTKESCDNNNDSIIKNNKILELILLGAVSILFFIINIRICPFYYLFKIPCPGCGLTRGLINIMKLDFITAMQYNILSIPLVILILIFVVLKIIKKEVYLTNIIKNNKKIIIVITIIITIVSFVININNPLLYK